jgi:uncharacterized protein (DUF1778 family)
MATSTTMNQRTNLPTPTTAALVAAAGNADELQQLDAPLVTADCKLVEHLTLTERDSRRVRMALETPPSANAKLRAVATDLL